MDVRIFDVQLLAEYDVQWSRKTFFGNNFKIHDIYTKSYQCQSNSFAPALNAILYKSISNYKPNYIDHCLLSIKTLYLLFLECLTWPEIFTLSIWYSDHKLNSYRKNNCPTEIIVNPVIFGWIFFSFRKKYFLQDFNSVVLAK